MTASSKPGRPAAYGYVSLLIGVPGDSIPWSYPPIDVDRQLATGVSRHRVDDDPASLLTQLSEADLRTDGVIVDGPVYAKGSRRTSGPKGL